MTSHPVPRSSASHCCQHGADVSASEMRLSLPKTKTSVPPSADELVSSLEQLCRWHSGGPLASECSRGEWKVGRLGRTVCFQCDSHRARTAKLRVIQSNFQKSFMEWNGQSFAVVSSCRRCHSSQVWTNMRGRARTGQLANFMFTVVTVLRHLFEHAVTWAFGNTYVKQGLASL